MSTDTTENPHDWTEEQAARIRAFAESGNVCDVAESHVYVANSERGVKRETCAQWRELLREDKALRAIDIDGGYWSDSAVQEHAYGGCGHDPEVVGEAADATGRQSRNGFGEVSPAND